MWSLQKVLLFTGVTSNMIIISVHMLEFCQKDEPDCQGQDTSPSSHMINSRWNTSILNLKRNLDHFRVSCEKLKGAFPIDQARGNFIRSVTNCIFSEAFPTPLKGPIRLAAVSKDALEGLLDLDVAVIVSDKFRQYVSGGKLFPGSEPLAHRYGGHQFGYWAGQLGDGRAHLLGHYTNRKGETWELQLKGSGKTPYSRSGDGRAVVRSSVREFLCSEAMYFLGIPTSRAASLVVSDEPVWRDQFYNGNVKTERGAVVLRLAKSWFRIGSLEILSQSGELDLLRKLLNFVIAKYFPSIHTNKSDKYLAFYTSLVNDTARLMAEWMSVGFAHGVCNTDNFSLLSVTIDYGPFGFMEAYDPDFVPNTSDDEGRYSYGAQVHAGLFNMEKLLDALRPLLSAAQQEVAEMVLKTFLDIYQTRMQQLFKAKLGLLGENTEDQHLVEHLLQLMEDTRADFTMTFRQLSEASAHQLRRRNFTQAWALQDLASHGRFSDWLNAYLLRLGRETHDEDEDRQARMKSVNPRYVLRNWMAESAIRKAEKDDFSEVAVLYDILRQPFLTQEAAEQAGYADKPPWWAHQLKVSCSS
ncbi:protein adenylyltransferase SelO-like [Hippocampus zosterae]|uniref:protein adenylyltransferase SelO-like n=1 Tax=Hippocampus zosterae TaxID=109293 RepID=UPI00223DFDFF|nr:protein adenylyltransferase SelO-like [Hippocampus zosterae]